VASAIAVRWNLFDRCIERYRFAVAERFISDRDATILDIGAGDGAFLRYICRKKDLSGIGYDPEAIETKTHDYTINSTPLSEIIRGRQFDIITMLAVIEHLDRETAVETVTTVTRALARHGRVIITTPHPRAKRLLEALAFHFKLISQADIADHKHYWSREELLNLLPGFSARYFTFQFGLNQCVVFES
jgi:2-polyprenyl-3-methyl-5-hydroxy-6-metoxy-1,4-benzoquinol methylase